MLGLLVHLYDFAEVYAVILAWIVIPLAYYAFFLFFGKHYGISLTTAKVKDKADG